MPPRIQHSLVVLVVLLAAYAGYAVIVDPFLVPRPGAGPVPLASQPLELSANALDNELRQLFPADSWELGHVNVVTTAQLCLIWKSHAPVEDRRLRVNPLTIIYRSAVEADSRRRRRTWIVRAAAGAVLQFEQSLDVAAGQFGRFHSGFIPGTVTASGYPESGGGDAAEAPIEVLTNNLQFDDQRIWTTDDIAFRWGPSFGAGNDLSIILDAGDKSDSGLPDRPPGAVQALRLMRLEHLHLALPSAEGDTTSPASAPVDISAAGPVEIDLAGGTCRVNDQVQVERHTFAGEIQRLRCQELLLLFTPRTTVSAAPAPSRSSAVPPLSIPKLELEEIQASGQPVVIESIGPGPSPQTTRRFEATEFHFRLAPGFSPTTPQEDTSWESHGSAWTNGPGRCVALSANDTEDGFTVRWQKSLTWQPIADGGVLRLDQDAFCRSEQYGEMRADQLELYLRQAASPTTAEVRWQPSRLIADGNVQLRSPQLQVNTQALQLNMRDLPPASPPPANELILGNPRPGRRPAWFSPDSGAGLQLQAARIELDAVRSPKGFEVQSARLAGGVECRELPAANGVSRLAIQGRELQLRQITQGTPRIDLVGEPAIINAESIQLTGTNVHADAKQNAIWMNGPGTAVLPLPADWAAGLPPQRAQALVTWHSGLHFDGELLRCGDGISLRGPYQLVRGDELRLRLARAIRLDQLSHTDQLILATTTVEGQVFVENRSVDRVGMVSIDSAKCSDCSLIMARANCWVWDPAGWNRSAAANRRG